MGKKRPIQADEPAKETKKQKVSKKNVQKAQSEKIQAESPPAPVQHKKKAEKIEKKASQAEIFSQTFYKKLGDFQSLYRDFLNTKSVSSSDTNVEGELKSVTDKVSDRIQSEAKSIFKDQLLSLQDWIQEQINKIGEEIKTIDKVYQLNRESLLKTGQFSQDQVKIQVAPIQAKISAKRQVQEKYEVLLAKSKQIYEEN